MLGDLNDYIVPAQSCVNPLFADQVNGAASSLDEGTRKGMARISLSSDVFSGLPYVFALPSGLWGMCSGRAAGGGNPCLAIPPVVAHLLVLPPTVGGGVVVCVPLQTTPNTAQLCPARGEARPDSNVHRPHREGHTVRLPGVQWLCHICRDGAHYAAKRVGVQGQPCVGAV